MAPLNRPPTKLHSKWSKLYQIGAVKGVVATVEDPETEESLTQWTVISCVGVRLRARALPVDGECKPRVGEG